MKSSVYNFSPGPGKLPRSVLIKIQEEFLDFDGSGISILEYGHRSGHIADIIADATKRLERLMNLGDDYDVLFLQGGSSLQFAMIPMNFSKEGQRIDFIDTGYWAKKAIDEAKTLKRNVKVIASSENEGYTFIPEKYEINAESAYLHICSNNTIKGTQFHAYPSSPVPVCIDMSSDLLSRTLDYSQFGCIYAHAQKTIGTAGVTLVFIRKDLTEKIPKGLPKILNYRSHIEARSIYNTPPVFAIYVVWLMLQWLEHEIGGIEKMEKINETKANKLYNFLDSTGFYRCLVEKKSRSNMNVVFRTASDEMDSFLVEEALKENIIGIKGHRSTGGLRASLYNPVTVDDVEQLVSFLAEFERLNG